MRTIIVLIVVVVAGYAQTSFEVVRKKPLWPNAKGPLVIGDDGVEFRRGDDESRSWSYAAIQSLDRISPTEITVLTYEDVAWRLGQDRSYRFTLLSGEPATSSSNPWPTRSAARDGPDRRQEPR